MTSTATTNPTSPVLQEEEEEEEEEWLLHCRCESPKTLVSLLQSLHWKEKVKQQPTIVFARPRVGLTIQTHPNPQFQSTLELPASLFSTFQVYEPKHKENDQQHHVELCISWNTLIDCLQVLTLEPAASLALSYHGGQEVLHVETTARHDALHKVVLPGLVVPTEDTPELTMAFGQEPLQVRFLCPSSHLTHLNELEYVQGVTHVLLQCQQQESSQADPDSSELPQHPSTNGVLRALVIGHTSRCQVDIPVRLEFPTATRSAKRAKIVQRTPWYQYSFAAWKRAMKPLELSTETCCSINQRGILAIQHQLVLPHDVSEDHAFCDCLLVPMVTEQDMAVDNASQDHDTTTSSYATYPQDDESHATYSRTADGASLATSPAASSKATLPQADDDDSHEEETSPAQSRVSLPRLSFGDASVTQGSHTSHQRRRQQRRQQLQATPADDGSVDLLASETPARHADDDASVDLLAASPAVPRRALPNEEVYCSSPEVVYGGD